MRILLALVTLLLVAGCCGRVQPQVHEPAEARERLGQTPCLAAAMLIKSMPRDGGGELFTLQLWATADGRVRVLAHKLDVDFLSALVAADGTYTAVLPRAKVWTRGKLGAADDPALLRDLALLVGELRNGPIPPGPATGIPGGWRMRDPATGWTAELSVDTISGMPTAKRLLAADGTMLRRLAYGRWQSYDSLVRPSTVTLEVAGDDATYAIRLKHLESLPEISPERMAMQPPGGAAEVDAATFAQRMQE